MSTLHLTEREAEKLGIARQHKYRAKRTRVDGVKFASKKEANRYGELKLEERAGFVSTIVLQPRFKISVNGQHICDYVADFSYCRHHANGDSFRVVEDVKGMKTPVYKLKKKLVEAQYGITITEI